MIESLFWSLAFRPYVTLFMASFLALSVLEQGWRRTLIWMASGYLIAFSAEWSSINFGFPFGRYVYHESALAHDLLVCGVPFFDSLSFSFLSYISYSFGLYLLSPLRVRGWDIQRVTLHRDRCAPSALILGSLLMTVTDLIIDPIALQGRFWSLGDIYHYPEPGIHFGVPLANYGGWFLVAIITLAFNQHVDTRLRRSRAIGGRQPHRARVPGQGLFAPLLWSGIVLFQLGVTFAVAQSGNPGVDRQQLLLLGLTGSFVVLPILALALVQIFAPARRASAAAIEQWAREQTSEHPSGATLLCPTD